MDKLKNSLIKLLSENARYSDADLAVMLGVTEKEVKLAIEEMEKEGAIVKYTAILDTEKIQKHVVQALIEVKVAPQKLKGFDSCAEEINNFEEVRSLYLMSGGFDLAVFVDGESLSDIAKFVAEKLSIIDGIVGCQTHFILKKYKIEGVVTSVSEQSKRELIQA